MSTDYNATVQLATPRRLNEDTVDTYIDVLAGYSPAIAATGRTVEITITLPAHTVAQAATTAVAVVETATGRTATGLQILTTDEFDRRLGLDPTPDLVSVTEAAATLGVSRQAVLQRLEAGTLPGQKVGTAWVIPAGAVQPGRATPA